MVISAAQDAVQASLVFNSVGLDDDGVRKSLPQPVQPTLPSYIIIISNDFPHAVIDDVEVSRQISLEKLTYGLFVR